MGNQNIKFKEDDIKKFDNKYFIFIVKYLKFLKGDKND